MYSVFFRGGTAIETNKKSVVLWVVFDGIENSVFQSQVLNVAGRQITAGIFTKAVILSFEKSVSTAQKLASRLNIPEGIELVVYPKLPFFGSLGLQSCVEAACNQIFKLFPHTIFARGPIAGYICLKALNKTQDEQALSQKREELPKLIIQARGLLKKEYEYANRFGIWNKLLFPVKWFIARQLESVERFTYAETTLAKMQVSVKIEAVTEYLANYLVEEFAADYKRIIFAKQDAILPLDATLITKNRQESRAKLGLSDEAKVYCSSGSAKPWQCIKETLELFCKKLEADSSAYLLMISTDKAACEAVLKQLNVPAQNYCLTVAENPQQYFKTMCAADVGLLMREENIINWVSKPTKVIDYLACGLKIEHNNTVAWVIDETSKTHVIKIKPQHREDTMSAKVTAATRAPKVGLKTPEKSKAEKTDKPKPAVKKTAGTKPAKATTVKPSIPNNKTTKTVTAKTVSTKKTPAKVASKSKRKPKSQQSGQLS